MLAISIKAILLAGVSCCLYFVWKFHLRNTPLSDLPGPPSSSPFYGNLYDFSSPEKPEWQFAIAKKYGRVFKLHGLLGSETLYISDPRALQHILVKNPYNCDIPPTLATLARLMWGENLLSSRGERHVKYRKAFNPVFSTAAIRDLTPVFYHVGQQLRDSMLGCIGDGFGDLDMLDWVSRASLECVGQGGVGHTFNAFSGENAATRAYTRAVKEIIPNILPLTALLPLAPLVVKLGPPKVREFLFNLLPFESTRRVSRTIQTMFSTSQEIFSARRKALEAGDEVARQQIGEGKDIFSALLKGNANISEEERLNDHELTGQINGMLFGANDSTSGAIARVLHVLANHSAEQDRLRKEVTDARAKHGDLGYDPLIALPFLDAVVKETLRLYPPVPAIRRMTSTPMVIPLATPIESRKGTLLHSLHIPAHQDILIGISAANRDPIIWGEDADQWKPERWIGKTVEEVSGDRLPGIYAGMMTFSTGPRGCIGWRFSISEIKAVLSLLLESFVFDVVPNQNVVWVNGWLAYPTTEEGSADTPHLPLRVSRVNPT